MIRRNALALVAAAGIITAVAACGPSGPVLSADPSGQTLYEQGHEALAAEDWREASEAFDTLLKNYPASPHLAEARLGLGKANVEMGRADTLIIGIDAFQSFLTYHPSHAKVDYAQYMIGIAYMEQMHTADRDQTNTRLAVEAFDTFLQLYPDSELAGEVVAQRQICLDRLAEHQFQVAEWQLRRGYLEAALDRARGALERFPETGLRCELLYVVGEALWQTQRPDEARPHLREIVEQYPDCRYAEDATERLATTDGGAG